MSENIESTNFYDNPWEGIIFNGIGIFVYPLRTIKSF